MNIKKIKKIELKLPLSFLILFAVSFAASVCCIFLTEKSVSGTISFVISSPLLFIINFAPCLILSLLLFFISGNAVFASILSGGIFGLMGVVNFVKTLMRQDPLIPSDLGLFVEAFEIVKGFSIKDLVLYGAVIFAVVFAVALSIILFRSKKIKTSLRIVFSAVCILCAVALNFTIYSNKKLYNSFPVEGNIYFEVNQYASKGFVYSFLHKFNTMKITKPEGYDKAYFDKQEAEFVAYLEDDYEKQPNVIMIMGEAYSHISDNEHIDFSAYTDPMKNFKEVSSGENAQSGYITVPSFGGGTSDTEFEVLTGLFKREMGTSMVAYSLIRKEVDALPQRLKDIGYDTLAIHPGFSWFYNRLNVYDYMGFDNFIHLESFQGSEKYKGGYIADKYATDCIIEEFEKHNEVSNAPQFQFCVTIQNHGPYEDKYEEVEKMFDTDIELTEHQEELLNSYFMGIRDADIEIKRLTDYFESIDEPVVLVYFGDHLPGFSNGMEFFEMFDYEIDADGTDEEAVGVYKTPYFIWQNSAAAESTEFNDNKDVLSPPDNTMNAAYLGAYTFELLGMDNLSPTLNYVNDLRKEMPVLANGRYRLADGSYVYELNEEQTEKISILKNTVYNKIIE